jgi:hypothetical protein
VSWSSRVIMAAHAYWAMASAVVTHAWRAARTVARSVEVVVAAAATMAACSYYDTTSTAAARSQEAAATS